MVAIKEFSAEGVTVTDEIVRCNEAVSISGTTYYRGYLANTCNENIQGNTSMNYGAYSAVAKGGTRYSVLISGYPVNNTQVSIDCKYGYVYSTTSATYYLTYLAHQPIKHNVNNLTMDIPYVLTALSAITIDTFKFPFFVKFGFATIDIQGGLPSADTTVTLSNGTESQSLTLSSTTAQTTVEFTAPLKVTTAETLTIFTTDGKGAYDLKIILWDI